MSKINKDEENLELDALEQSIDKSAKEAIDSSKKTVVSVDEDIKDDETNIPSKTTEKIEIASEAKPENEKILITDGNELDEAEELDDEDEMGELSDEQQQEDLEAMGYAESNNEELATEEEAEASAVAATMNDSAEPEDPGVEVDSNEPIEVEEPKKVAGPLGPYQPKTPDSNNADTPSGPDEDAHDIDDMALDNPDANTSPAKKTISKDAPPAAKVDKDVDSLLNLDSRAAQSSAAAAAASAAQANKKKPSRMKRFFRAWWNKKPARYATMFLLFAMFTAVVFVPVLRYGALNLFGVRVSSSLFVVDSQTGLPLENIPVILAGEEKRTNEDGYVEYSQRKLGTTVLAINKLGYATYEKDVTLGLGSNPLNEQPLVSTGAQYLFRLSDFLSDIDLTEASAKSGEDVARANDTGEIRLTVGDLSPGAEVTLSADGYRDESLKLSSIVDQETEIDMVPAKKHVFVSNRTGEYDLYKIDVDGANEEILLPSTGKEREIPYVLPHPDKNVAAYISSRDGEQNADGFVYDGLFIVDVDGSEEDAIRVIRSEQLQVIGWIGDKLIYVAVVEGVSAGNSQRSKLYSYDIETTDRKELATSNYFNDVKIADNKVYYAVSSFAIPESQAKFYVVDGDGENTQKVVDTQVWSIIRKDYNTLLLNAINRQWFELPIATDALSEPKKLDNQPANTPSINYEVSPDTSQALWTDVRDGKGVLIRYDVESGTDEIITTVPGLGVPAYWLASNNYVVYRVTTSDETADYILNLEGGESQKIADVVGNRSRYFY